MLNNSRVKYLLFVLFIAAFTGNITAVYAQSGFNDALSRAKNENKRVIVDVYTDWCGWCKKMDTEVYGNTDIVKIIEENFIFVKLDAESSAKINYNGKQYSEQDLASYFEATGYPTTVFLEPDGKLIEFNYDSSKMKNIPGFFKASEFKKILNFIKDGKYKDSDLSKII